MPGPWSDTSSTAKPSCSTQRELDRARPRRILDRVRHQVVDHRADLLAVADDDRRRERGVERDHPRERRELLLAQHARARRRPAATGPSVAGSSARVWWYASRSSISFCSDSVFSRTMRTISCCSGDSAAADVVAQELRAFAHGGERRLELVRHVAQEARLLLLELGQARAQPFEPLADVAQVLRTVHLDRVREIRRAHLADRLVELADRARDQHGEDDRERDRDRRPSRALR